MPGCLINGVGKMIALEIEDDVIEAIKGSNGLGLSIKDISRIIDIPYNDCYGAIYALEHMRKVKVAHGAKGMCVILPEWVEPYFITARQKAVLDYLCSQMDRKNMVRVSYGKISTALILARKNPSGGTQINDAVECLDRKGYLAVLERGNHLKANLYKVYPNRDGPRGYSWP